MKIRTVLVTLLSALTLLVVLTANGQSERPVSYTERHDDGEMDGEMRFTWVEGSYRLQVRLRGEITFADDHRRVERLSSGGYLNIEESDHKLRQRIEVTPSRGSGLEIRYYRNGSLSTIDAEAAAWLGDLIEMVVRETGVDAERHVARLLEERGVNGVLDEIEKIRRSGAMLAYALALVDQADLSPKALDRLAQVVDQRMSSSGDRTKFFIAASGLYLAQPETVTPFFYGVSRIPSSGDRSRVLLHTIETHPLDAEALVAYLGAARDIPSSGDRASVLIAAAPHYMEERAMREAFFGAVRTIPSSGDRSRVLLTLLEHHALEEASLIAVAQNAAMLPSSGDRASVLIAAAPDYTDSPTLRAAYFDAVSGIPSAGDHTRVLLELLEAVEPTPAMLEAVLASARKIASSGDRTRVLVAVAPLIADDEALVERYLEVAKSIPSSGDQARALSALVMP